MTRVALLGVGLMGAPVSQRLLAAGIELVLWNRSRAKLAAFEGRARLAATPAEAVANVDMVITLLENGTVVDAVLYQTLAIKQAAPGTLVVDMSSIAPAMARQHAAFCAGVGLDYIDAPVSGGTRGAAAGTLTIMAGGAVSTIERARPLLDVLGRVTRIGDHGAGQVAKLANQAIVGITIEAVAEALLLASTAGADPAAVREALMGGFAASKILDQHGERMLERNFVAGAPARVQLKDMNMIAAEAELLGLELPLVSRVQTAYKQLVDAGHAEVDHAGLLLALEAVNHKTLEV